MEKWLLVALAFPLTVLVCLTPTLPRAAQPEAVIEGRPISFWAQELKSEDATQRREAALALGKLGPEAKDTVPALTAALKGEDRVARILAARALGEIGPDAKAAVPELRQALVNNTDGPFLREIITAMRRIEGRQ